MAQKPSLNQVPTGKVYRGKGIRLTAGAEPLEGLIRLSRYIQGSIKLGFMKKYGNIIDLLHVPVHNEAIIELGQYWDVSLRCFTFSDFQLAPTLEEYGEILRMPLKRSDKIYHYPGRLPSQGGIAKLLGVHIEEVQIVGTGQVKGIKRTTVEAHLTRLAENKDWESFCRIFALAMYGMILFPSSAGIIDLGAISVFQLVEHYQINPVPAILAETYMSLSQCHLKKEGRIKCCLALLEVWMLSHVYGKKKYFRERHDKFTNPLMAFNHLQLNKNDWRKEFSRLTEDSLLWKIEWWEDEEIIHHCGDFSNVPLMGPRGCINYNPSLALRQLAFRQKVPSQEEVQAIHFSYEEDSRKDLCQKIKEAWSKIAYKGKIELGKREIGATPDYKDWLKDRIKGANPSYSPQDPLLGNDAQKINKELARRLEAREKELEELSVMESQNKRKMSQLEDKCASLQEELTEKRKRRDLEECSRIMKLEEENKSLKRAMKENDRQMKNNRVRLLKMTTAKESLEEKLQDNAPLKKLQGEVDILTQLLENKKGELVAVRASSAETIQSLVDKLNHERKVLANWELLYHRQVVVTEEWVKRCGNLINFANTKIPEFASTFKRAEGMIIPLNPPSEIVEFFNLCNQIVEELKLVTKF